MKPVIVAALVVAVVSASGHTATSIYPESAVYSPDGAHVAWIDGLSWQLWIADADGSEAHTVGRPFADGVDQITWTRFGLIVDSNFQFFRVSPAGVRTFIGDATGGMSVGGRKIATGSAGCGYCRGPVYVYDIVTHARYVIGSPLRANGEPALSPDGRHVVYTRSICGPPDGSCDHNAVFVEAAVAGRGTRRLPLSGGCEEWSPNGRWLSYLGRSGVTVMSLSTGRSSVVYPRVNACIGGAFPGWSPDSMRLATVTGQGPLTVVNVKTRTRLHTPRSLGDVYDFAWSPDGNSLLVSARPHLTDGCFSLWKLDAATLQGSVVVRGCP